MSLKNGITLEEIKNIFSNNMKYDYLQKLSEYKRIDLSRLRKKGL